MIDPSVQTADALLRKHGIRYVVIGGQAIALSAATTTRDVDVMVTSADYRQTVARLGTDDALTLAYEAGAVTRFGIVSRHGAPLDVIDAGFFAGKRTGAEFFDYLQHEASTDVEGIRYVSPEAVWYTRLLTKRWRAYAEKIVTNVIDGIDAQSLDGVLKIARRFGTDGTILERIAYVREELRRPDVESLAQKG